MKKYLRTIIPVILFGLLVGLFVVSVVFSSIDKDFYSQYYTARGIFSGYQLYGDFSDNKGPVLYLFFVPLYAVFREQLSWAYLTGSLLVHGLTIVGVGVYVGRLPFWKRANFLSNLLQFGVVSLFALQFVLEGIYAESIGMMFLVWGLVLLHRKRLVFAGVFVVAALACRQTLFFMLPFFGYEFFRLGLFSKKNIFQLGLGGGAMVGILASYLLITSDVQNFFHNAVEFNINYAQAVHDVKYKSILVGLYNYGMYRPLLMVLLSIFVVVYCFIRQRWAEGVRFGILLVCSFAVVFSGGIFYQHHFWQFLFMMVLACMFVFDRFKNIVITWFLLGYLLVTSLLVSVIYVLGSGTSIFALHQGYPAVSLIQESKYMVAVTFSPDLYFAYNKLAPDKYFQPFFMSKLFNSQWRKEFDHHLVSLGPVINETVFVQLVKTGETDPITETYLQELQKTYPVTEVLRQRTARGLFELRMYKMVNQTNAN